MPFSKDDYQKFLQIASEEQPREELRRIVMGEQAVTARLDRVEHALVELATAQQRTEQRLEELAAAQQRTEERIEELAAAQQRTEQQIVELAAAQGRTVDVVGQLEGLVLEWHYERKAPAYFGRLLRKMRTRQIVELEVR